MEAHEPDFPEGDLDYTDFLTILGYSPDSGADGGWWRKRFVRDDYQGCGPV